MEYIWNPLSNKKLISKFREDFTFHSSVIEGSTVSEKDNRTIGKAIAASTNPLNTMYSMASNTKENDVIENGNLYKLFDYITKNIDTILTHEEIWKYHFILKENSEHHKIKTEEVGKYRKTNVTAGGNETINFSKVFLEMEKLLENFKARRKETLTIEDVCEFHKEFERIHPFLDGNGRIGRIIMFKQCISWGILPFYVSEQTQDVYKKTISEYIKTNDNFNFVSYIKKQQFSFEVKYSKYFNISLNANEQKIISFLSDNEFVSRKEIEVLLKIKHSAVQKIVNGLIKKELIVSFGNGPLTKYSLV